MTNQKLFIKEEEEDIIENGETKSNGSSSSTSEEDTKTGTESGNISNKMDLAFSGAGFMGCYYFGVVDCWRKYIPRERIDRVAGTSAGSLIAAYYLMDLPLNTCLREIVGLTEEIRKRPLGVFDRSHQIVDALPKILDKLFPDDAHKRVSNRLYVCMTRLKDMKKVLVNEFASKKELIDALNCSCFIPVWSGNHVPTFKGVKHIDGGFSDQLPAFDEHTVRVCCFSGDTDISPYDKIKSKLLSSSIINMPIYLNFANCRRGKRALFPPTAMQIVALLENGFQDTKDFILSNDLIQCDRCYNKTNLRDQPIFSRPSPRITPSVTPRACSPAPQRRLASAPQISAEQATGNNNLLTANRQQELMFSRALSAKLEHCSRSAKTYTANDKPATTLTSDLNNNINCAPTIVISGSGDDDNVEQKKPAASGRRMSLASGLAAQVKNKGLLGARRNTSAQLEPFKQQQRDRFTLVPNPLPSCPPSPNLNRHCVECIRMRQEARNDLLEEEVKVEATKLVSASEAVGKSGILGSKLGSPLRWIRQLRTKSSYDFDRPAEYFVQTATAS